MTIIQNVCFAIEPKGWALRGFFSCFQGRMPTSDAELLRVSGRANEPGDYVFFSYDDELVFTRLFEEEEAEGYFKLAEASGSVVVKREVSVPAKTV